MLKINCTTCDKEPRDFLYPCNDIIREPRKYWGGCYYLLENLSIRLDRYNDLDYNIFELKKDIEKITAIPQYKIFCMPQNIDNNAYYYDERGTDIYIIRTISDCGKQYKFEIYSQPLFVILDGDKDRYEQIEQIITTTMEIRNIIDKRYKKT